MSNPNVYQFEKKERPPTDWKPYVRTGIFLMICTAPSKPTKRRSMMKQSSSFHRIHRMPACSWAIPNDRRASCPGAFFRLHLKEVRGDAPAVARSPHPFSARWAGPLPTCPSCRDGVGIFPFNPGHGRMGIEKVHTYVMNVQEVPPCQKN